ncbi:LysR substrate-binding domain-containing protein [Acidicapsa acidisoli]|uniref:LysR substrate-binding domain-containing protein n=1 Tax=Acidicapsa acidisoli TaxID=1615681 RepID=UPI0021DF6A19|nr:LysR substrate-binding domain-containing protein [Acidicapsa acidisoli]
MEATHSSFGRVATAFAFIFLGLVLVAQASGHWQTDLQTEIYGSGFPCERGRPPKHVKVTVRCLRHLRGHSQLAAPSNARGHLRLGASLELLSVEAIKQCTLTAMGIAVLPEAVIANEQKRGTLVTVDWPRKPLLVYMQMFRHQDKWMSPVMSTFWNLTPSLLQGDAGKKKKKRFRKIP